MSEGGGSGRGAASRAGRGKGEVMLSLLKIKKRVCFRTKPRYENAEKKT